MTREIKFRVWDGKCFRGNLHEYFINLKTGEVTEVAHSDLYDEYYDATDKSDKFTLQQYTGLKDKNKVEIYEGDIVSYFDYMERNIISPVYYVPAIFSVDDINGEEGDILTEYIIGTSEMIVIGNILENPDLIPKNDSKSK